jgi:hypothetical protein
VQGVAQRHWQVPVSKVWPVGHEFATQALLQTTVPLGQAQLQSGAWT